MTVKGKVTAIARDPIIRWIAADPPNKIFSRFGSFQAFPNPNIAVSGRNCGTMRTKGGEFAFTIDIPNSFYAPGGTILIPPHFILGVHDGDTFSEETILLKEMFPLKGLTWAP